MHKDPLSDAVMRAIKPLYMQLTDINLLQRCLRGATQNANECFNGTLWRLCPKETFCSATTVETSAYLAVLVFSHGSEMLTSVSQAMSCPYSLWTIRGMRSLDTQRPYHSKRKSSGEEKKARKHRRAV